MYLHSDVDNTLFKTMLLLWLLSINIRKCHISSVDLSLCDSVLYGKGKTCTFSLILVKTVVKLKYFNFYISEEVHVL